MNIILVQNTLPTLSGAGKSNQIMLEGLAGRGHTCHLVAPAIPMTIGVREVPANLDQIVRNFGKERLIINTTSAGAAIINHQQVAIHLVYDFFQLPGYFKQWLEQSRPDWVIVSAEEPSSVLLQVALETIPDRVLALAQTALHLPFGPGSFIQDSRKTQLLQQTAGIITFSHYMKSYVEQWGQIKAVALPYITYGPGPFPRWGRFDTGFVTMINPCNLKGITLFLALARCFPDVQFAAVPTWGTTEADQAALAQQPNVTLLPPSESIDDIFAQTRILLVPSLWHEAFGLVAVEAMLRGIPVLASNVGGLPEAKLGVDYLLPVNPIKQYSRPGQHGPQLDPIIPEQEIDPWRQTLARLLSDANHYNQLAQESYTVANRYVAQLDGGDYERFLLSLQPAAANTLSSAFQHKNQLSPQQRTLLAMRLRQKMGQPAHQEQ
jgi:glycosyltransferase involved in cell wall biosynthesis